MNQDLFANTEQRPGYMEAAEVFTYRITHADESLAAAVAEVEKACFPPEEAASYEAFRERVRIYGNHFWLLWDKDVLVGFVDGFVTDEKDLTDEMFADAGMHREDGAWQMIFGVNTLPEYRRRGCAQRLLKAAIHQARREGRKGLVLTCKEEKIHFYAGIGFEPEGKSSSEHGGAAWYQMRLTFHEKKPVFMEME